MIYLTSDVVKSTDNNSITLYHGLIFAGNTKEALFKVAKKQAVFLESEDYYVICPNGQVLSGYDAEGREHEITVSPIDEITEVHSFKINQ
jgi:hypothetical protein